MMGIAIGAGNIWRFSRVVAQNGGGSFIIPWVIFLFIWSIPLIFSEIALGKLTHKGPIGTLIKTAGKSFGWMGGFIAVVTTGILFYYSVVVGWGFSYFFFGITGQLTKTTDTHSLWEGYTQSLQPLFFHIAAIVVGCYIIYQGISKGIERANKILIPTLLVVIFIVFLRAITLPGAWEGIAYLFIPNTTDLFNYQTWIEALSQNAWDTGAGWGLMLVYAGYIHRKESVTKNGCITAFSNNAVSLIMGIIVFSTAFSLESEWGIQSLATGEGSTNIGLTFIYLTKLFQALPGGEGVRATFATIFFLAFSFAALSSMISMVQLTAQVFRELGLARNTSIFLTGLLALLLGSPSAINMAYFDNQDWVWSNGLIINGLFIAFAVIRYGANRFRKQCVNISPHDFKIGKVYNFLISVLIPTQGILLIGWFFYQSIRQHGKDWWNPFLLNNAGTLIFQWGIALIFLLILNKWLVKRTLATEANHAKQ